MKNNSSKIWTIIKHEYLIKIKSKGFIIGTIAGPLVMIAIFFVPIILTMFSQTTERKIAILDKTEKQIGITIMNTDTSKFYITNKTQEVLDKEILEGKCDGYLLIPYDILEKGEATVYSQGGGGLGFISLIESAVKSVVRHERLYQAGISNEVMDIVEKGVNIQTRKITEQGNEKDFTESFAFVGYILGLVIYILMLMYGSLVSRGVTEEKTNRIVEVIASSVKPFDIMMGKVIGIGAVGLTQVMVWVGFTAILLYFSGSIIGLFMTQPDITSLANAGMNMGQQAQLPLGFELPHIPIWLFVAFVFYFIMGYFIYSTLFAAVGSAVDQESDAAQLQTVVTMPLIIPILMIGAIMSNPDSIFAVVASLIPFFTPIIMMVRLTATTVPIWQVILSCVLLIITFFTCIWVSSRIYRVGILMYGKKPTFKDLIKWFRIK